MAKSIKALALSLATASIMIASAMAHDLPGADKTVRMARATWDTGWFQAEIYRQALRKLGYEVATPATLDNLAFYQAVGQGDIDLWVNGWFPLHDSYAEAFEEGAEMIGYVARNGALQGYMIDRKTADEHGITNLADFKKDKIKALFDSDGNGKAEMVACPPVWRCEQIIAEQLDKWELRDHIEPIKDDYSAAMAEAVRKYKDGKPILFYAWTPNWTVGVLKPGKDVVWIETPESSEAATVADVEGCAGNPCEMGWEANDIRPVANKKFLEENPSVRVLLENMSIPLADIFAQNAKMNAGEDKQEDIERHASEWIKANQDVFDGWIKSAMDAAS
ncbi:MAG TPA: glycine betaine/L-proline ABC transporter substrate-binding protein ProX [Hyphomicrobiales bacterium]|nr:glycine betaine/L-proline ABC transporter substrate-binding protein ProX [Hyphomicrobiales bacterium]